MFVPVTSPGGLSQGAQGFADVLTVGAGAHNRSGRTSLEDPLVAGLFFVLFFVFSSSRY